MTGTLLLGVGAAVLASLAYNGGLALQALDARSVPSEHSLRPSLIGRLLKRPRFLIGTALTIIGWPLQTAALLAAPLTLVQPALAVGLVLLLVVGSSRLGESVGVKEIVGVAAIVIGVAGLTWAGPEHVSDKTDTVGLIVGLSVLGFFMLLPYVVYHGSRSPGVFVALAAGFAYAFDSITTKLLSDALSEKELVMLAVWGGATAAGAGIGFLNEMTALQTRPATQVAPLVFTVQLLGPVLLAPIVVNEDWSSTPLGGAVLISFVLLVAAGAFFVASSSAVGSVVASDKS